MVIEIFAYLIFIVILDSFPDTADCQRQDRVLHFLLMPMSSVLLSLP